MWWVLEVSPSLVFIIVPFSLSRNVVLISFSHMSHFCAMGKKGQ